MLPFRILSLVGIYFIILNPSNHFAWAEMRELSTDRPDKTESPYSVDAGHFQVEASILNRAQTAEAWDILNLNLKYGMSPKADVQAILTPIRFQPGTHGMSDLTVRLKYNVMGNDQPGAFGLGVMPYVTLPVGRDGISSGRVNYGFNVPMAMDLPHEFEMGMMAQLDFTEAGQDLSTMVTFGHDLFENVGMYLEFFNTLQSLKSADWVSTVDTGLTYKLTPFVQLDCGLNIGITDAADKLELFTGISAKF